MLQRSLALVATVSLAASPCAAAGLDAAQEIGDRRSGAVAGVYLSVPFNGARSGKPQAGLRLQMAHDYRDSLARNAPVARADALDLRLIGDRKPTLYVANMPVTGEEARKRKLLGGGIVNLAILGLAVVGGLVIYNAIDDDEEDNCLDPATCD